MSNPLSAIRKHQAKLLVIFGIIIMFSFTVGPIIIQVLQSVGGRSPISHEVVLTWSGGTLREEDFDEMRVAHYSLMKLQEEIIRQVTESKGSPKVPPMADDASDQTLAMTKILARKAKEAGIVITDDDAENYLYQMGDGRIPRPQFPEIAESLKIDYDLALGQLKQELTALNLIYVVQGSAGGVSPVDAWEYFNRLHRYLTIEALPLPVEDYLDEVTTEPTESEIQALYDKHKYDYQLPDSTDPGFKRPLRVALSYVRADYEQFVDRAKANVTDEQVQEYYDKNKENYKILTLDSGPGETSPDGDKPNSDSTETPDGDKPDTDSTETPDGDKPGADSTEKPDGDKPDTDSTEKPDGDKPNSDSTETPDGDKPDTDSTEKPDGDSSEGDAPTTDSGDKPEADQDNSDESAENSTDATESDPRRGGEANSSNCDDAVNEASDESSAEPGGEGSEVASDDEPQSANVKPNGDPAGQQDDDPSDQPDSPTENPTGDQPANPSDEQPEKSASGESETDPDPTTTDPDAEQPKDKYRPLEEVADQIRRTLALAPAQEEMEKAIQAVESAVNRYQPRYKRWQVLTQRNPSAPQPEPPEPEELAQTYGLSAGTTPLVDVFSIRDYDIGKISETNQRFRQEAFREGIPEYKTSLTYDIGGLSSAYQVYVYWRTQIAPTEVPELNEVRDDVVYAWKLQQARELAREDAQRKAQEVARAASMKDLYGEAVITVGPFTWMRSLAVPTGFGQQVVPSEVPDIEKPGDEFMRSVFSLEKGETGVAINAPESVVYVVRVVEQTPTYQELRERFFRSRPNTSDIQSIGENERYALMADWYRGLAKEMDVQWKREPHSGSNR